MSSDASLSATSSSAEGPENHIERVAAGLRDEQRAAADGMLECLRRQQETTEQLIEWLAGWEATSTELVGRMRVLEHTVEALQQRLDLMLAAPPESSSASQRDAPGDETFPAMPTSGHGRRGAVAGLLRSRGPGACAVCRRAAPARRKRDLVGAGWVIAGAAGICRECRTTGWGLRDGGLPFRRRAPSP
jgi:hypothetical protein